MFLGERCAEAMERVLTGPPSANIWSSSSVFDLTFERQVQKT
jgi:hypothetical protein